MSPVRARAGLVAFTLDWEAVELVWSRSGYPSDPAYSEFHRLSMEGSRLWTIGGRPYDPEAAAAQADAHAREFGVAIAERLTAFEELHGKPGLVTFAIDTELLGHWWSEGPAWLEAVLRYTVERGIRLVTLAEALERHEPEERALHDSTWGEGKDLHTWDSPEVADLAWAGRRLELRLLAAVGAAATRARGRRARGARAAGAPGERLGVP